jgi:hypothetical protein
VVSLSDNEDDLPTIVELNLDSSVRNVTERFFVCNVTKFIALVGDKTFCWTLKADIIDWILLEMELTEVNRFELEFWAYLNES